jgi:hypothetical protein
VAGKLRQTERAAKHREAARQVLAEGSPQPVVD